MFMNLLELLDRIYTVLDKLDPKHPNVKKVNKILSTAEKAILSWAKIIGIMVDDIKEIKNPDETKDPLDAEEWSSKEEDNETPEEEADEMSDENEDESDAEDWKRIKIKAMFWKLPDDKKEEFKWKLWDKFNSLWL